MNNRTIFFVIAIFTGEFTIIILRKYGFKVSVISFGFYSTYFRVYIYLPYINTHRLTTAPFYSWFPLSRVSALHWYDINTVLRFVWYRLVFIQLILKFIYIYLTKTQSDEKQHHFIRDCHCHGWVHYIDTTKIRF